MGFIGEEEDTEEITLIPGRELEPATAPAEAPATPEPEPVPA